LFPAIHLHGEATGTAVYGAHTELAELSYDAAGDALDVIRCVVKLDVRKRAGGTLQVGGVHPAKEADESFRLRKGGEDVGFLAGDFGSFQLHEADVVGTGVEAKLAASRGVQGARHFHGWDLLAEFFYGGMFVELHGPSVSPLCGLAIPHLIPRFAPWASSCAALRHDRRLAFRRDLKT